MTWGYIYFMATKNPDIFVEISKWQPKLHYLVFVGVVNEYQAHWMLRVSMCKSPQYIQLIAHNASMSKQIEEHDDLSSYNMIKGEH